MRNLRKEVSQFDIPTCSIAKLVSKDVSKEIIILDQINWLASNVDSKRFAIHFAGTP